MCRSPVDKCVLVNVCCSLLRMVKRKNTWAGDYSGARPLTWVERERMLKRASFATRKGNVEVMDAVKEVSGLRELSPNNSLTDIHREMRRLDSAPFSSHAPLASSHAPLASSPAPQVPERHDSAAVLTSGGGVGDLLSGKTSPDYDVIEMSALQKEAGAESGAGQGYLSDGVGETINQEDELTSFSGPDLGEGGQGENIYDNHDLQPGSTRH